MIHTSHPDTSGPISEQSLSQPDHLPHISNTMTNAFVGYNTNYYYWVKTIELWVMGYASYFLVRTIIT